MKVGMDDSTGTGRVLLAHVPAARLHLRCPFWRQRIPHMTRRFSNRIDVTDRQIDRLVYELYDLTDDEIKIVEEATAK